MVRTVSAVAAFFGLALASVAGFSSPIPRLSLPHSFVSVRAVLPEMPRPHRTGMDQRSRMSAEAAAYEELTRNRFMGKKVLILSWYASSRLHTWNTFWPWFACVYNLQGRNATFTFQKACKVC
jgi:hypothetical protein